MAKSAREIEQEFVATIEEKTGHTLASWLDIIGASGESKTNAIIKWLKTEHSLNHMQSSMLAGIYLNDGQLVHDYASLLKKLFVGKENQRPIYEAIVALIQANFSDAETIPTKTYVSFEAERGFATAKINKRNVRIGLDLGDLPFNDTVQKAKALGAMPRYSHMIEVTTSDQVNDNILPYLQMSYDRVH